MTTMSELALIFWIRRSAIGTLKTSECPQSPVSHAADPASILNDERIVEPERLAQSRERLRIALRAHDHRRDVAGKNGR